MPYPEHIVKSLFYEQKNGMSDDMTKSFEAKNTFCGFSEGGVYRRIAQNREEIEKVMPNSVIFRVPDINKILFKIMKNINIVKFHTKRAGTILHPPASQICFGFLRSQAQTCAWLRAMDDVRTFYD